MGTEDITAINNYLGRSFFGSQTNQNGVIETRIKGTKIIYKSGPCIQTTVPKEDIGGGTDKEITYSKNECMKNTLIGNTNEYERAAPNGSGWCFTDATDQNVRGFCRRE